MKKKIILFKDDKIGEGELGSIVGGGFIQAIAMQSQNNSTLKPDAIVFLNRAVLFGVENNYPDLFDALRNLEKLGVDLEFCETCLNYFHIKKLGVGRANNAMNISAMLLSNEVLSL